MKKVSFLIAAYNEEEFLEECISSCLNQEDVLVEVCVVDDGSQDNTANIIRSLASADERIKYRIFPENKGKVCAFNEAYKLASGEYISLVGADDVNALDRSKVSVACIELLNVGLVYSDYFVCDESLVVKGVVKVSDSIGLDQLCFNNKVSGGTVLFNRVVAQLVFPIPEVLRFEDWWVAFVAVLESDVARIDKPLLYYRHHGLNDSISSSFLKMKLKDFSRHFVYYEVFFNYLRDRQDVPERIFRTLQESEYFKRLYVADNAKERLRLSYDFVKKNGLPKTSYGWIGLLLMTLSGGVVFDLALWVKGRLR